MASKKPYLSVVIPIYNEEATLSILFERLMATLDQIGKTFEVIFTNDGSKDKSIELLKEFQASRPDQVKVIDFHGNFGQHMAIMAGFELSKGAVVINLDADLQNPPEEIPRLLEKFEQGHDYVGTSRAKRTGDNFYRHYVSKMVNWLRDQITDIRITDQGCMLRAYSRRIVDMIVESKERSTFIPALGYSFALNPIEFPVRHDARAAGESKYTLYMLIRVAFDLITGFSLVPLQIFTLFGMFVSALSGILVLYMVLRRLIVGPEAEGLFTLFAILFFLISVLIMGIGIIGEYVGRVSQTLSNRPRYIVKSIFQKSDKN